MHTEPIQDFAKQFHLTPRETEVLQAIALQGLSNEEAAKTFFVHRKTLSNHIQCIFVKTRSRTSRELLSKIIHFVLDYKKEDGVLSGAGRRQASG